MYKRPILNKTGLRINKSTEGETMEMKVTRIQSNKEPIKDGAPLIYTEKKDGVMAGYDIRHDKWETATEAMDKVNNPQPYQNEARIRKTVELAEAEKANNNSGTEPIQTTS